MDIMTIYNQLPIWGQNLACYYEGSRIKRTRYGKGFWRVLAEYENRADWSYEQLCHYRDTKLRIMIHHCYDTVPYYTKLFNDGGINPNSIKTLDDLKILPMLTKQIIKDNPDSFKSIAPHLGRIMLSHTGGTTGSGLVFNTTLRANNEQWAVWWRYRRKLGINDNENYAVFGGKQVVPSKEKNIFYRRNLPCHQYYYSVYHISPDTVKAYVISLAQNEIKWLHGYPSAISYLAKLMLQCGLSLPMHYVTTSSETLSLEQILLIKDAFGVIPYQHYALGESVASISEDIEHTLRVNEDFAAVEFVQTSPNGLFEIIGTSLTNFAMPMLRYKTMDLCSIDDPTSRVIRSIDGRTEDFIVLPNGSQLGRVSRVFMDMPTVREAQLVQTSVNTVDIYIVKDTGFSVVDEKNLLKKYTEMMPGVVLRIIYTDYIERSKNGKLRLVKSML